MDISKESNQFEVFFDGECPLCRREIDMLSRWDEAGRILFTDISSVGFSAESVGKPMTELMKTIHGRFDDGEWVTGVEVFRQLYARVGFDRSIRLSRWPLVRHSLDLAYRVFAYFRYRSALRRMRRASCDLDRCGPMGDSK